jgi:ketosteroid isomerase-like protein
MATNETNPLSATEQVTATAAALIQAFADHDPELYFSYFEPSATFTFHGSDERFTDLDAYRRAWREWEADGFRVEDCISSDGAVQLVGAEAAVFTHRLITRLAGQPDLAERETIVFHRAGDGRWLGIHEHASLDPKPS